MKYPVRQFCGFTLFTLACVVGCGEESQSEFGRGVETLECQVVSNPQSPIGTVRLKTEKLIKGLEVPWAIGFLPGGDYLVTERPGRVRRVSGGKLVKTPLATLDVGESGEGGLMGMAIDPNFAKNRLIYLYYTTSTGINRLDRYRVSADRATAAFDKKLVDQIPSGTYHNGGRLKFGPDGYLYLGTGDARQPNLAQNAKSLAGKLLRISPQDGSTEKYLTGIRNLQAFDWTDSSHVVVADHGPSGELGLSGRDEVSYASAGANLGWPVITACQSKPGMITPFLSWSAALPPGGLVYYRGSKIPSFEGSVLVTALGAQHLHRIKGDGTHDVYLAGGSGFGRLRDIVTAPDGSLYVTTSNCDGRGDCGADKDLILRVTESTNP